MKKLIFHQSHRLFVFAMLSHLLVCCYSYKPVVTTQTKPAELAELIKPGQHFKIKSKEGREMEMTVKRIDHEIMYGTIKLLHVGRDLDHKVRINHDGVLPLGDIETISRRRVSAGKTVAIICTSIFATIGLGAIIINNWTYDLVM